MKAFKKIIPAVALLLVSAVLLGTSTYAWFALNTQVTVSGITINANSNATYLLIGTGDNDTASEIQAAAKKDTENGGKAATLSVSSSLIPSAYKNGTDCKSIGTVSQWYTGNSSDPGSSTLNGSGTELTKFDGYVETVTLYLTLAEGAGEATNLTVSGTFADSDDSDTASVITPVHVVVASSSAMVDLNSGTSPSTTALNSGNLTDGTVVEITLYIYYDGNDEKVFTNNAANLAGVTINLTFTVEVAGSSSSNNTTEG